MAKVVYCSRDYKVLKCHKDYVLVNLKGEYENHGHFEKEKTCMSLIKWMRKGTVPKKPYLRQSVLIISTDEKYKEKVRVKIEKDAQRQYYFNPNKGVRK